MGRDSGRFREEIRQRLLDSGACAVGFAKADVVADDIRNKFSRWIESDHHAEMGFMANHCDVRTDARLLLEGARTVISLAFPYRIAQKRDPSLPVISSYAFLPDYHKWIKKLIRNSGITDLLGKENSDWRICVDSAPVMERYWAWKAGIAIIGCNGSAIVPGTGSEVFLAEIICKKPFDSDIPIDRGCGGCTACLEACPTGALQPDGTIDCNRCISYLTIEHRGEWSDARHIRAMSTEEGRTTLFGCDRCISACPHNKETEHRDQASDARFQMIPAPLSSVINFQSGPPPAGSSLKRAKTEGLLRNIRNLKSSED